MRDKYIKTAGKDKLKWFGWALGNTRWLGKGYTVLTCMSWVWWVGDHVPSWAASPLNETQPASPPPQSYVSPVSATHTHKQLLVSYKYRQQYVINFNKALHQPHICSNYNETNTPIHSMLMEQYSQWQGRWQQSRVARSWRVQWSLS